MSLMRRLFRKKSNFSHEISSPDGQISLSFILKDGHMNYSVRRGTHTVIHESGLGLQTREFTARAQLSLVRLRESEHDDTWSPIIGEEKNIRNHYKEAAFYLAEDSKDGRLLTMRFRVFNDGVAFRYEVPPQPNFSTLTIEDELTDFTIDYNSNAYCIPAFQPDRYEYNYYKKPILELTEPVHTPLTIKTPRGGFVSIHEAALYDYGEMTLQLGGEHSLRSIITPMSNGAKALVELPWNTPWRVIMLADTELGLVTNRMVLNLNDPPRGDFSWVKPLKFAGIWWAMYVGEWTWAPGERHGATTEHALDYLSSCHRLGLRGLLIEGWNNGWDGDWLKNGAHSDFTHPEPDFDIASVAKSATEQGIELVGHHETVGFVDNYESQLESAYKYYSDLGIHYIKSGYAGSMMEIDGQREWHHSAPGVRHYQKALELAARYRICLNVHEPIKGTGIERTWPNLLTREGARGQEYEGGAITPSHACFLPFTRLLAGGMDYTSGIFDLTNQNKRIASTLARQLAYYVTIFSGMQMAADRPRLYEESYPAAFKFIRDVPLNWEQSLPLLGLIGEFFVIARKDLDSPDWYIGGVTNGSGRRVRIGLDFLDPSELYHAEIYRDADDSHYRDNPSAIIIESRELSSRDSLDLYMAPGGGFAIRLTIDKKS